jgi:plasmid stabilization system protein ParE
LKQRRVRFTSTAQKHVEREKAWWLENRDHAEAFAEELEQALKIIAILPGAGSPYAKSPIPNIRRVYLRRVGLHLYYTFNDDDVIVRTLWAARREHGPEFKG